MLRDELIYFIYFIKRVKKNIGDQEMNLFVLLIYLITFSAICQIICDISIIFFRIINDKTHRIINSQILIVSSPKSFIIFIKTDINLNFILINNQQY